MKKIGHRLPACFLFDEGDGDLFCFSLIAVAADETCFFCLLTMFAGG